MHAFGYKNIRAKGGVALISCKFNKNQMVLHYRGRLVYFML